MRAHSLLSCLTLCDPMDCSLPGSSVHGILQARILEWVAMSSSKGSSQPWDGTQFTNSVDMDLNKLWEIVKDKEAWHSEICGYAKSQTQLSDCKTITWPNSSPTVVIHIVCPLDSKEVEMDKLENRLGPICGCIGLRRWH